MREIVAFGLLAIISAVITVIMCIQNLSLGLYLSGVTGIIAGFSIFIFGIQSIHPEDTTATLTNFIWKFGIGLTAAAVIVSGIWLGNYIFSNPSIFYTLSIAILIFPLYSLLARAAQTSQLILQCKNLLFWLSFVFIAGTLITYFLFQEPFGDPKPPELFLFLSSLMIYVIECRLHIKERNERRSADRT